MQVDIPPNRRFRQHAVKRLGCRGHGQTLDISTYSHRLAENPSCVVLWETPCALQPVQDARCLSPVIQPCKLPGPEDGVDRIRPSARSRPLCHQEHKEGKQWKADPEKGTQAER